MVREATTGGRNEEGWELGRGREAEEPKRRGKRWWRGWWLSGCLHEPAVVRVGSGRRQPPHRGAGVRVADAGCAAARVIFSCTTVGVEDNGTEHALAGRGTGTSHNRTGVDLRDSRWALLVLVKFFYGPVQILSKFHGRLKIWLHFQ